MHFKIDRAAFLNELQSLQGVVSAKQLIPALSHLLIETKAGRIAMRATDLDITVKTECAASVRKDGSICLPARKLTEIVKSLAKGGIEIKTNDLCQATITSNGSRFKLHGMDADSFPDAEGYSGEYAEIHAEIFSRFIPRVIHAAGQEESRYTLNGAKLEITNERIRMVATDGHRLALVEREGKFAKTLDVLIPKKSLAELAKLCASGNETLPIDYAGEAITAGFNAAYLNNFLSAVEEDEILLEFKDGQSPAQLSVNNAAEDRCRVIVMPMRM